MSCKHEVPSCFECQIENLKKQIGDLEEKNRILEKDLLAMKLQKEEYQNKKVKVLVDAATGILLWHKEEIPKIDNHLAFLQVTGRIVADWKPCGEQIKELENAVKDI